MGVEWAALVSVLIDDKMVVSSMPSDNLNLKKEGSRHPVMCRNEPLLQIAQCRKEISKRLS